MFRRLFFFFFLIALISANSAYSADINLTLSHQTIGDHVTVVVANNSSQEVRVSRISVELDGEQYVYNSSEKIASKSSRFYEFLIKLPSINGSYPLIATVYYFNKNKLLSLKHVALYHYNKEAILNSSCLAENVHINESGEIVIQAIHPEMWYLVLPEEVSIISSSQSSSNKTFQVNTRVKSLQNKYPYFVIAEKVIEGQHYTSFCSGSISIGYSEDTDSAKGKIPSAILLSSALFFLLLSYFTSLYSVQKPLLLTLSKYASRMFLLTFSYYFLKNVDIWLEYIAGYIKLDPFHYFILLWVNNFRGINYQYFFTYFIDYYWIICLLLTYPYLYFFDRKTLASSDKYVAVVKSVLSVGRLFRVKCPFWDGYSKLGILTIGVKIFYIPYLISWVINNTFHQNKLIESFHWDFATVNIFLVALFIYIDTAIYGFGYVVESKYLKNEIKTVEPTILGWVVCLWCYPPFNEFSFRIFDFWTMEYTYIYPEWVQAVMTCVITTLWGVFAWASVALGFKASNLTNRGIVQSGPYRFVRHPAYAAKLLTFVVSAIFFGGYGLGILLGFTIIYALRAWTEERHLSRDPVYIDYKKSVKWRYIPGII